MFSVLWGSIFFFPPHLLIPAVQWNPPPPPPPPPTTPPTFQRPHFSFVPLVFFAISFMGPIYDPFLFPTHSCHLLRWGPLLGFSTRRLREIVDFVFFSLSEPPHCGFSVELLPFGGVACTRIQMCVSFFFFFFFLQKIDVAP